MAITANDIRERKFETVMRGYNRDDVDDYLDEIANRLEELENENASLKTQLAAKPVEKIVEVPVEVPAPAKEEPQPARESVFNEPSYFKNLESTLRETLISAQRIADDTVNGANKQAAAIIADAQSKADTIDRESEQRLAEANARYADITARGKEYYNNLRDLLAKQQELLDKSPLANN